MKYRVYINKAYFPPEVRNKYAAKFSEILFDDIVQASSRTEAAKEFWGKHAEWIIANINPRVKEISLNVNGSDTNYDGRMTPIYVWTNQE